MTAGKCRICECTDERACAVGCAWVQDDLCSVCDEIESAIVDLFAPRTRNEIVTAILRRFQNDLVEEGDCDERRIRKALADLVRKGALERPSRTTYALPGGGG